MKNRGSSEGHSGPDLFHSLCFLDVNQTDEPVPSIFFPSSVTVNPFLPFTVTHSYPSSLTERKGRRTGRDTHGGRVYVLPH